MFGTVSPAEVVWVAVAGWGAIHHLRIHRAIRHDIHLLERGVLPVSDGAMALFRADAESEFDWTAWKTGIALVGVIKMTQPPPYLDWQQITIVSALMGLVLWTRWRSELRSRRRNRIICGRKRDKA